MSYMSLWAFYFFKKEKENGPQTIALICPHKVSNEDHRTQTSVLVTKLLNGRGKRSQLSTHLRQKETDMGNCAVVEGWFNMWPSNQPPLLDHNGWILKWYCDAITLYAVVRGSNRSDLSISMTQYYVEK